MPWYFQGPDPIDHGKTESSVIGIPTRKTNLAPVRVSAQYKIEIGTGGLLIDFRSVRKELNKEINAGLADPKITARIADLGAIMGVISSVTSNSS
jgi:hypothetical protein